jgi:hypothetical protein
LHDEGVQIFAYRHFQDELVAAIVGLEGVENGRELLGVEFDVDDGT